MEPLLFLDANIFMYAAGKSHSYKNPCLHILKDVETQALASAVDTEILQELLYRYTHIGLADKGIQLCNDILRYPLKILPVMEADMRLEIDLFDEHQKKGVKPRDTIHAAIMKNNGITKIISADKDFDNFDFLARTDPKDYVPHTL